MLKGHKLTFEEAIERLNDQREVSSSRVLAKALRRKVWLTQNGLPGCMPNSSNICVTKADAIATCVLIAGDEAPRWFKSALNNIGSAWSEGESYTIKRVLLGEVL